MDQIECLGYGFKAEHSRILGMQLTLKKIKLLEFYKQIECIYKIVEHLVYLYLLRHFTSYIKGTKREYAFDDGLVIVCLTVFLFCLFSFVVLFLTGRLSLHYPCARR